MKRLFCLLNPRRHKYFGTVVNRIAYYSIWALLLFIFFIRTMPRFWTDLRREKTPTPSPTSSIDRQLESTLRVAQASSLLTQALAQLPKDSRVIVAYPAGNEQWEFVQCAMAYLSWPRKIETMKLGPNENFTGVLPAQTAVFFCGLPAPPSPTSERINIAPNLELLRPLNIE
jgi:hypothetical protein